MTGRIEGFPVNIHLVLDHIKTLAQSGFARHIRFMERYDPSLPPCFANRDQLVRMAPSSFQQHTATAFAFPCRGGRTRFPCRWNFVSRITDRACRRISPPIFSIRSLPIRRTAPALGWPLWPRLSTIIAVLWSSVNPDQGIRYSAS